MAATLEKEEEGKEEGKEAGSEGSSHGEKEDKATEEESQTPKAPRRPKTMQIKVTLLDDTLYECELEVRNNVVIFCLICETILWVVVGFFFFLRVCVRALVSETCQGPGAVHQSMRPPQSAGEGLLWAAHLGDAQNQGEPPASTPSPVWSHLRIFPAQTAARHLLNVDEKVDDDMAS